MNWKKVRNYASYGLYLIPFAGAIIEYYKPKEKKTKVGTIFSILNVVVPLAKIAMIVTPCLIHKSLKENAKDKNENKLEQMIKTEIDTSKIAKDKKAVSYEEILK